MQRNIDADCYAYQHANRHRHSNVHADCDAYPHSDAHAHAHGDADHNTYGTHPDADSYRHTHRHPSAPLPAADLASVNAQDWQSWKENNYGYPTSCSHRTSRLCAPGSRCNRILGAASRLARRYRAYSRQPIHADH